MTKQRYKFNPIPIINYIKENELSKAEFCRRCKITPYILRKMYLEQTNFDIVSWVRVANTLNVNPAVLITEIQ